MQALEAQRKTKSGVAAKGDNDLVPYYRSRETTALEMCIEDDEQEWVPLGDSDDDVEKLRGSFSLGTAASFLECSIATAAMAQMNLPNEESGYDNECCVFYDSIELELQEKGIATATEYSRVSRTKNKPKNVKTLRKLRFLVPCRLIVGIIGSMMVLSVLFEQRLETIGKVSPTDPTIERLFAKASTFKNDNFPDVPSEGINRPPGMTSCISKPSTRPMPEAAPSNAMESFFVFENTTKPSLADVVEKIWRSEPTSFPDSAPRWGHVVESAAGLLAPAQKSGNCNLSSPTHGATSKMESAATTTVPHDEKVHFFAELSILDLHFRKHFSSLIRHMNVFLRSNAIELNRRRRQRQRHRLAKRTHCRTGNAATWRRCFEAINVEE
jgi:hypothetical protein